MMMMKKKWMKETKNKCEEQRVTIAGVTNRPRAPPARSLNWTPTDQRFRFKKKRIAKKSKERERERERADNGSRRAIASFCRRPPANYRAMIGRKKNLKSNPFKHKKRKEQKKTQQRNWWRRRWWRRTFLFPFRRHFRPGDGNNLTKKKNHVDVMEAPKIWWHFWFWWHWIKRWTIRSIRVGGTETRRQSAVKSNHFSFSFSFSFLIPLIWNRFFF